MGWDVDDLYHLARSVVSTFCTQSVEFDDLVQEAVLKGWEIISTREVPRRYVYRAMRNRVLNYLNLCCWREIPHGAVETAAPVKVHVPIPRSNERLRAVTVAMIRNGSVKESAKELGWNYFTTVRVWRDAKREIRKLVDAGEGVI